jgi:hypothetical protein
MMDLAALSRRSKNAAAQRKHLDKVRGIHPNEDALHKAVADFLSIALSSPEWWTTFPAGGGGVARGAQLKAKGLKAGVPDLLFIKQGRAYWIELKSKRRGIVSDDQRLTAVDLRGALCPWAVCRTVEEVEERLTEWGFNLKAHFRRAA